MHFSPKINSIIFVICILLLSTPIKLFAGEWCCDDPVGVIIGKTDPKTSCGNMGRWSNEERTKEDYFLCALSDISYGYGYIISQYGHDAYSAFIKEIARAYNEYPNSRSAIENILLYRGYYADKSNRATLNNIMNKGKNSTLWNLFVNAVDGKPCGQAKIYYQYCSNKGYLIEYFSNYAPTLDEIVECQKSPQIVAHSGTLKCIDAQSDLLNKTIDMILKDQPIKKEYLQLLEDYRVRYIKNSIYAKHGRVFQDKKLASYFTRRSWYRINRNYSDALLSSMDKRNLAIIVDYESKLHFER